MIVLNWSVSLSPTMKSTQGLKMATDTPDNKTKVLVNVYEPLITIMKHKFDAACLKRDAYLDRALKIEAGFLRKEVPTPNSEKAKCFIVDNLKKLKLKPLNLLLSVETVELINEVCKEKNIPRDAFINRFILLLIASDNIIDALFFRFIERLVPDCGLPEETWSIWYAEMMTDWRRYDMSHFLMNSPNVLDGIEFLIEIDPFNRLRDYLSCWIKESKSEEGGQKKIYNIAFEKNSLVSLPDEYAFLKTDNVLGFNTYMSDYEVSQLEALEKSVNAKLEADKLLAFAKKEKQIKRNKVLQAGGEQ